MQKNKKTLLIVGGVGAAAVAIWWFMKNKDRHPVQPVVPANFQGQVYAIPQQQLQQNPNLQSQLIDVGANLLQDYLDKNVYDDPSADYVSIDSNNGYGQNSYTADNYR